MPTLLAGIRTRDPAASTADMFQTLDRLNALQRWGLIPGRKKPAKAGSTRWKARPAAPTASWRRTNSLRLPCSAAGSSGAATRRPGQTGGAIRPNGIARRGRPGALDGPSSANRDPAFVWFDLDRGGKTLRLAVATYSLKLLLDDPRGSQPLRQQLNEVKAWIDTLAPMNVCRIGLGAEGGDAVIRFDMGE
jgi:hypothetical protein